MRSDSTRDPLPDPLRRIPSTRSRPFNMPRTPFDPMTGKFFPLEDDQPYVLTRQRVSSDPTQTITNNTLTTLLWPGNEDEDFELGAVGTVAYSAGRFTLNYGRNIVVRASAYARLTGSQAAGGFEDVNGWHQMRLASSNSTEEFVSSIPGGAAKALTTNTTSGHTHTVDAHHHTPRRTDGYWLNVTGIMRLSAGDWFEFHWWHVSDGQDGEFQQGRVLIDIVRRR